MTDKKSNGGFRLGVQKFGTFLSGMVMPNIAAFIAWGLRLTGNNNLPYIFNAIPDISKENNSYSTLLDIKKELLNTEKSILEIDFEKRKLEMEFESVNDPEYKGE